MNLMGHNKPCFDGVFIRPGIWRGLKGRIRVPQVITYMKVFTSKRILIHFFNKYYGHGHGHICLLGKIKKENGEKKYLKKKKKNKDIGLINIIYSKGS